jgi:cation:H+ antiporter
MREDKSNFKIDEILHESNKEISLKLFLGLLGIYFAGQWVVDGAIFIASQLGVGEFLISATVIALGTSLPELAVCISAVLKKETDLAVGNIIGSNIFNILLVMGIMPLVRPVIVPSFVLFDIALMFFATLLLFIFMFTGSKKELKRNEGIIFIVLYILYIWYLIGF